MDDMRLNALSRLLDSDINTLKGYEVLCLPENLRDRGDVPDLYDGEDSADLAKAMRASGLKCGTSLDLGVVPKVMHRRGVELWLGTVWILERVAVPVALGVIANFVTEAMRKRAAAGRAAPQEQPRVHITLDVETEHRSDRIVYDGDAQFLTHLLTSTLTDSQPRETDDDSE